MFGLMSAKKHEAECARLQHTIDEITEDANLWRTQSYEADLRIEKRGGIGQLARQRPASRPQDGAADPEGEAGRGGVRCVTPAGSSAVALTSLVVADAITARNRSAIPKSASIAGAAFALATAMMMKIITIFCVIVAGMTATFTGFNPPPERTFPRHSGFIWRGERD